jgi:tungstate transport system permease protein
LADLLSGFTEALRLIGTGDPTLYGIVNRTLFFSGVAIILAMLWGTPIAMVLGLKEFRGKTIVKAFFNSLIGIPTVALGLVVFLIFSRGGPLGFLGILYTPGLVMIGQAVLITPILISIVTTAIESVDPEIVNLAKTLGASESQASIAVLREALNGFILGNIASFNRAIAELGVVLLVGGNIAGLTDVLTTAISRSTQRGDLGFAIALGIILMILVFTVNIIILLARKAKTFFIAWRSPQ